MSFHLTTNKYQILTVVSSSMLELRSANDNEMASNKLSWTLACRRILLEADADPTLSQDSHFDNALEIGTVVGMFFRSG